MTMSLRKMGWEIFTTILHSGHCSLNVLCPSILEVPESGILVKTQCSPYYEYFITITWLGDLSPYAVCTLDFRNKDNPIKLSPHHQSGKQFCNNIRQNIPLGFAAPLITNWNDVESTANSGNRNH